MNKLPEYETEDLLDGRFAFKKNGLVIFVGRSQEELDRYIKLRNPDGGKKISIVDSVQRI